MDYYLRAPAVNLARGLEYNEKHPNFFIMQIFHTVDNCSQLAAKKEMQDCPFVTPRRDQPPG